MNIVFCIPDLGCGGAERVISKLANDWVAQHTITIITLSPTSSDFYSFNSNIERICIERKKNKWYNFFSQFFIVNEFRKNFKSIQPDYIISFLPKTNIFVLLSTIGTRHKVIACERNIINEKSIDKRQHFLRKILYPRAYKITVQHEEIYDEILESYPSIKKENVFITPNPISPFFCDSVADPHSIFNAYPKDGILLLGVGRFTSVKAFPDMIRMFSLAIKKQPLLRFAIFGEGALYTECQSLIQELGLKDFIVLPGATENINAWYAASDIFVTTTHFEGFPNALAEALSAGLPAVAFKAPSIGVLIKDNENGYLINNRNNEEMADKIVSLSKDIETRKRFAENARRISNKYSEKSMSDLWFEKVLC